MNKVLFLASTLGGVAAYSLAFLLLMQVKFIRNLPQTAGQEAWLTTEVILGTLTFVVTLSGIVFLFVDRMLAGRYFLIAVILGAVLTLVTTAGILGRIEPPRGLEAYSLIGLVVGNMVVVACNVSVFYFQLPSI